MMKKQTLSRLMASALVLALALLAGCAGGAEPEASQAPSAAPEQSQAAEPSAAPIDTPEPSVEPTAAPEPSAEPTAAPEPSTEPAATPEPSAEPAATPEPAPTPTPEPAPAPTPEPAPQGPEDGNYTANVTLAGGTGRASVQSPTQLRCSNGQFYATIVWSSPNFDYMKVGGVRYDLISAPGSNSTFEIPVAAFDQILPVVADTVAMSEPHEVEYTLTFDSASLVKQ